MARVNSGIILSMQSAIGTATAISAATNAAPGVFSSEAHGLLDGDIILLRVSGMIEVNERVFVVVNKATDTFQIKNSATGAVGIDTTDYGVFASGTFEKVTLGITIPGCQGFSSSGGDVKFVDITTVSDIFDKQQVSGANPITYNLSMLWNMQDPAQIAMQNAFVALQSRVFRIKWPDGAYALFYGSVGYAGVPGGEKQGATVPPAAIALNGTPTYGIA
jgi:hypothetical protein